MKDIINCGGGVVLKCSCEPQGGLVNYCNGCFYGHNGVDNLVLSNIDINFNTCLNNVCINSLSVCQKYKFDYDPKTDSIDLTFIG